MTPTTFPSVLKVAGRRSPLYLGRWATRELAEIARDRAILPLGLDAARLDHPRRARRLGPASPDELRRLARQQSITRSTKYAGVSYAPRTQRFYAYVDHQGTRRVVGIYRDEEEAAVAVDRVLRHFGRTDLNFPDRRLRAASPERIKAERSRERKRHTTSRYIGVVYAEGRSARPWYFYVKGTKHHTAVGGFGNEREAALAHDRAALRYCTKPILNFPDEARALGPVDFATLRKEIRAERKKTTSSRYRGVTWNRRRHKWYAGIMVARVYHHLGVFDVEEDAARAYDASASRLLGDAAILNFPDELTSASRRRAPSRR